jgi:hypothetical protein
MTKEKKQQKQDDSRTESSDVTALPPPETLALIAATVSKVGSEEPAIAVAYAAMLYDAACAHLERKARYLAARKREVEAMADIPQPDKFPAPFDDFLRLIVGGKTLADRTKRFRDFLRYQQKWLNTQEQIEKYPEWLKYWGEKYFEKITPQERLDPKWKGMTKQQIGERMVEEVDETRIANQLADWKRDGFSDRDSWFRTTKQFRHWWAGRLSDQARTAAKKSKKSS